MPHTIDQNVIELAHRHYADTEVWCEWNALENEISIRVISRAASFVMFPPNDKALDAFNHPFFYMDRVLTCGQYR